jgi:hypothetical protein
MQKIQFLIGLFVLIVVVLVLNPRVINDIHKTILGRIMLIGLVIFFTAHNTTLGLLVALCLIIAINMFFMEGIDETLSKTIGDDNVTTDSSEPKIKVSTALKESEEKEEDDDGVDKQTVHESIQPIESAAIPVNKGDFKSIDVAPLDPDNVKQGFSLLYS